MHYNFNETKERRIYNNVGTGSDVKTYLQWKEHVVDQHKNASNDETKNFIKFLNAKKRKYRVRNEISLGMILPILVLIITLFSSLFSSLYSQMEQISELNSEITKYSEEQKLKTDEILKSIGEDSVNKTIFIKVMTMRGDDLKENINQYYRLAGGTFIVSVLLSAVFVVIYKSRCKKIFFLDDYIEILESF
ncbi:MAG: hypothetical protein E6579_15380 [Clostridium sp.]|uniref:hypothetical protein n=1 Tax=Faecalispora jeddahensis TaxID=1414721 RepID=UPI0028B15589|nr:hypothetical protein [Faecalispora jeddahensis]MDU6308028.1 hypothetical protein [Clostridium sp.]